MCHLIPVCVCVCMCVCVCARACVCVCVVCINVRETYPLDNNDITLDQVNEQAMKDN
jgi:hypothetical protein